MAILSKNTFTYRAEQIHAFLLVQHELTRSQRCFAITQHNFKEKLSERTTVESWFLKGQCHTNIFFVLKY